MKLWCAVPTVTLLPTSPFPPGRISIHKTNLFRFRDCSFSLLPRFRSVTATKEEGPCKCGGYASPSDCDCGEALVVVNFYRFVFIDDPQGEVDRHVSFLKGRDVHGRIYTNKGLTLSGPSEDVAAYVEWLKEDKRFSDILVQMSPAINGHAFPKLKVQYKPLVQVEGGISHLPLLDPSMQATPLEPSEWRNKLEAVIKNGPSDSEPNADHILLDVIRSDPLANADKERTNVLMYCTGGIRCDVYSTILSV